jgi:hypothetical protein
MRELLLKLADALHYFDDSHPLLKEIDDELSRPAEPVYLSEEQHCEITTNVLVTQGLSSFELTTEIEKAVLKANKLGDIK